MLILDAHAHFYDAFHRDTFLDTAAARFQAASKGQPVLGCLLLADVRESRVFESWRRQAVAASRRPPEPDPAAVDSAPFRPRRVAQPRGLGWWFETSPEEVTLLARNHAGALIAVVAGRQIRAEEGLEILAFGTREVPPDGAPFGEALHIAFSIAPLVIVPWGFGKWVGMRGELVRRALERHGDRLCLGDSGGRPGILPSPRLFRVARALNVPVLSGSDPLPFPSHVRAVARLGSILDVTPDFNRLFGSTRAAIDSRCAVQTFGRLEHPGAFVQDQLRLRWRHRVDAVAPVVSR